MRDKRQTTILTVISLLTLFFAVVGATFAYFTITVKGNEEASSVVIRSAVLGQVVFEDGQIVNLVDIYPGDYATKTFTVKNTSGEVAAAIRYYIYLDQTANEFAAKNIAEFMHEIIESTKSSTDARSILGTLASTTVPSPSSTAPIITGTLYGNDTHSYTYKIGLIENHSNQNTAQGLSFKGVLRVEIDESARYTSSGEVYVQPSSAE